MDNQVFQKIKELLIKNENIGIAVGTSPTLDDMASALSLYLALSGINKKVVIACPSEPLVELSSLVSINKVKTGFETSSGDLVVSFPYREGEIEKVSYTLEGGSLNIIVKAGEQGFSFDERQVVFKRGSGGFPNLLFIVGTPRLSDLNHLFNPQALKDTVVVNIDNKVDNQGFGDVVYVSTKFSSVSEQMTNLLLSLDLRLDLDISQNLMSGISFATDNFQKQSTSSLAFEMAAFLMKNGAIREKKQQKPQIGFEDKSNIDEFFGLKRDQKDTREFTQSNQFPNIKKRDQKEEKGGKNPPSDWLTPKIYKGSTSV